MDFDLPESSPRQEPADRHRPGPGWAFFLLVLVFAIGSQLPDYFNRTREEKERQVYRQVATALKVQYLSTQSIRAIADGNVPAVDVAETKEMLDPYLAKGAAQAAALWVATKHTARQKIAAADLVPLEKSKEGYFNSMARVYRAEKLSEPEATALAKELSKGISGRIAAVVAYEKAGLADPAARVFSQWELHRMTVFALLLLLVIGAGVLLWIVYGAMRAQGRFKPSGHPVGELSAPDADRFAFKAGVMLLLPFAVPFLLLPFVKKDSGPVVNLVYYAAMIVAVLLIARAPVFGKRFRLRQIGWRKDRLLADAGWGLAAAIANVPILFFVAKISELAFRGLPPPEHPSTVAISNNPSLWTILITLFAASIAAPIIEETMFRGFLVPALSRITGGFVGGWIVGGVAFAAVHPTGIPAWLPLATVGAMAAALNHQTGSLVSSVFMHAFHNLAILTLAVFVLG